MSLALQLKRNKLIGDITAWERGIINHNNGMFFNGDTEKNRTEANKLVKRIAKAKQQLEAVEKELSA